jgi:hypothetical protein
MVTSRPEMSADPETPEQTIGPGVCDFAMELWNSIFLTLVRSLDFPDVEIDNSLPSTIRRAYTNTHIHIHH